MSENLPFLIVTVAVYLVPCSEVEREVLEWIGAAIFFVARFSFVATVATMYWRLSLADG